MLDNNNLKEDEHLKLFNFINNLLRQHIELTEKHEILLGELIQYKYAEEQFLIASHHDTTTGLLNRTTFEANLKNIIDTKSSPTIAILMFDIDRFSQVMTAIGHEGTDVLLQKISERLRNLVVQSIENAARLVADKFVIYLHNISSENEVSNIASKILYIFNDPFFLNNEEFFISTHIGVALYPRDGNNEKTLIQNAYIALQHAGNTGINNIKFCSDKLPGQHSAKLTMQTALRRAITNKEFCLYYQPKRNLKTGKISGLEALIRWNHPQEGIIEPMRFLSLAEETDLIIPINEWAFREVCHQTKLGWSSVPIAINLSALHFKKKFHLVPFVKKILNKYGLQGNQIEIEVTESILLENTLHSLQILTSLKKLGFSIALDDFGTGFSSFNYLLRIPADTIKIDKSFIDNIPHAQDNISIVNAIIALSHSLKKKIIAEGVENIEQYNFLANQQCDEVQGYYISPPLGLDEIQTLFKEAK